VAHTVRLEISTVISEVKEKISGLHPQQLNLNYYFRGYNHKK